MKIKFSADIIETTGINKILRSLDLSSWFSNRYYTSKDVKLFFVINCLDFVVKNRVRFSKKNETLYWDIILDYVDYVSYSMEEKKYHLANAIIDSLDVIKKYPKLNIDLEMLKADMRLYFIELNWIKD